MPERSDQQFKDLLGTEAIYLEKGLVLLVKVLDVSTIKGLSVRIEVTESPGDCRKLLQGILEVSAAPGYFHVSDRHLSSSAQGATWTISLAPEVVEQAMAVSEELAASDPEERLDRLIQYLYSNR